MIAKDEPLLKYSNQYFLVLKPTVQVVEKINEVRLAIYEVYKTENFPLSFPYVRLITFSGLKENEIHVISALKLIAQRLSPLQLVLKDFRSIPTHTIYINVALKVCLKEMVTQIKKEGKLNPLAIVPPHYLDDFYIPMAIKLKPWQYEKLSLEYSHSSFSASCLINEIQLLKREEAAGKIKSISKFHLQGFVKTVAKQGNLF